MPFPLSSPGWCHIPRREGRGEEKGLSLSSGSVWMDPSLEWWLPRGVLSGFLSLLCWPSSLLKPVPVICLPTLWLLLTTPPCLCQFPHLLRNSGSSPGPRGSSGCEKPESWSWTCGNDLPSITSTSLSLDRVKHVPNLNAYKLLALGLEKLSSTFSCKPSKWSRGLSNLGPAGHMQPRMAVNAAWHKIVNLLKTIFSAPQFSLVFAYLMCGPRQFFVQCGPETPKIWTRWVLLKHLTFVFSFLSWAVSSDLLSLPHLPFSPSVSWFLGEGIVSQHWGRNYR